MKKRRRKKYDDDSIENELIEENEEIEENNDEFFKNNSIFKKVDEEIEKEDTEDDDEEENNEKEKNKLEEKSEKQIIKNKKSKNEDILEEKPKKKKYPIDPKLFTQYIVDYYETGIFSEQLGEYIHSLATRMGTMPNFCEYTYLGEMISDSILKQVTAVINKKFDPKRGNAFSYFTTISLNSFKNRIKKEEKNNDFIQKFKEETYKSLMEEGFVNNKNETNDNDYDRDY